MGVGEHSLDSEKAKHPRGNEMSSNYICPQGQNGAWLTAQSSEFPWGWRVAGTGVGIKGPERGFSPNLARREQLFIIICPGGSDQVPFCRAISPQSRISILSYIWD